jgi:hypothetical protein
MPRGVHVGDLVDDANLCITSNQVAGYIYEPGGAQSVAWSRFICPLSISSFVDIELH